MLKAIASFVRVLNKGLYLFCREKEACPNHVRPLAVRLLGKVHTFYEAVATMLSDKGQANMDHTKLLAKLMVSEDTSPSSSTATFHAQLPLIQLLLLLMLLSH